MKVVVLVFCVVLGLLPSHAQECDNQLVCERARQFAQDVCATHGTNDGIVIGGRIGKQGPKGEKGDKPEPAVVDYERILQKIEEMYSPEIDALVIEDNKTKEMLESLNKSLAGHKENTDMEIDTLMIKDNDTMAMMEKLNKSVAILKEENTKKDQEISAMVVRENAMIATIERLNESIASLKDENRKKEQEVCKVYYGGKCFWFVRQRVTYAQGEAICSKTPDGRVAIIYNAENYQQIQVYMRLLITGSTTHYNAWLGLKIYPASGRVVTLPGETEAPFKKWQPGYPATGLTYTTYTNMVLSANKDPSSSYQGMFNYPPTAGSQGVLCEA